MNTANVISAVSTSIAGAGLAIAFVQFVSSRNHARTESKRLAQQEERLRNSTSAALGAMEIADLLVQRSKEKDASSAELRNIGRALRGTLLNLARQLENEKGQVASWQKVAATSTGRWKSSKKP